MKIFMKRNFLSIKEKSIDVNRDNFNHKISKKTKRFFKYSFIKLQKIIFL